MCRKFAVISALAAGLIVLLTAAPVRSQTNDKLTYVTFSGSVQIPGATLPSGTYRFRLADESTGRKVIQVLSGDAATVYSMFHTMPDFRLTTTDESVVTFKETPAGVPPVIQSLFYGGESNGYEFVYPDQLPMVAFERPQPPITYSALLVPRVAEVAVAEVAPAPVEVLPAEPVAPEPAVAELPKTASPLPLVALFGLGAVLTGLGARTLRRHLT